MRKKTQWVAVLAVVAAVVWFALLRWPAGPVKSPSVALTDNTIPSATASRAATRKTVVVIQTGQERMSNAVRCMAYIADLSNKLPKEHGSDKPMVMAIAGGLFFEDCLMAKISNGYIAITTNELRQSFSNAVTQLFTNGVPRDLVDGFDSSFADRNNMHLSLDEQYQRMTQYPETARTLKTMDTAFQQAGITDADQSDLKELCLSLCEVRTSAYLIYGPQSAVPVPSEYQAMADSLDKVLEWRLTNMYGLDEAAAQALVQSVARVPVHGFSKAGLVLPALFQ